MICYYSRYTGLQPLASLFRSGAKIEPLGPRSPFTKLERVSDG